MEVRLDLNEYYLSRKFKFIYIFYIFTESLSIGVGNTEVGGAVGLGRLGRV